VKTHRFLTASVTTLVVALSARAAHANPGITGYSGKPYNGTSATCDSTCHTANNPAPTLNITIPASVTAGSTNEVTVVVQGTRQRTSMNAAFSDGVVATKGMNTEIPFPAQTPEEVGAVEPPPNGATGTYKFSFKAPATNGTITMWLAAMSASGAGTGGDGITKTTRTVTVTGGTTPPTDAGTDSGTTLPDAGDAGGRADSGPGGSNGGSDAGSSSGEVDGPSGSRTPTTDDGGCAVRGGSGASSEHAALAGAWLTGALVLLAARRRRR